MTRSRSGSDASSHSGDGKTQQQAEQNREIKPLNYVPPVESPQSPQVKTITEAVESVVDDPVNYGMESILKMIEKRKLATENNVNDMRDQLEVNKRQKVEEESNSSQSSDVGGRNSSDVQVSGDPLRRLKQSFEDSRKEIRDSIDEAKQVVEHLKLNNLENVPELQESIQNIKSCIDRATIIYGSGERNSSSIDNYAKSNPYVDKPTDPKSRVAKQSVFKRLVQQLAAKEIDPYVVSLKDSNTTLTNTYTTLLTQVTEYLGRPTSQDSDSQEGGGSKPTDHHPKEDSHPSEDQTKIDSSQVSHYSQDIVMAGSDDIPQVVISRDKIKAKIRDQLTALQNQANNHFSSGDAEDYHKIDEPSQLSEKADKLLADSNTTDAALQKLLDDINTLNVEFGGKTNSNNDDQFFVDVPTNNVYDVYEADSQEDGAYVSDEGSQYYGSDVDMDDNVSVASGDSDTAPEDLLDTVNQADTALQSRVDKINSLIKAARQLVSEHPNLQQWITVAQDCVQDFQDHIQNTREASMIDILEISGNDHELENLDQYVNPQDVSLMDILRNNNEDESGTKATIREYMHIQTKVTKYIKNVWQKLSAAIEKVNQGPSTEDDLADMLFSGTGNSSDITREQFSAFESPEVRLKRQMDTNHTHLDQLIKESQKLYDAADKISQSPMFRKKASESRMKHLRIKNAIDAANKVQGDYTSIPSNDSTGMQSYISRQNVVYNDLYLKHDDLSKHYGLSSTGVPKKASSGGENRRVEAGPSNPDAVKAVEIQANIDRAAKRDEAAKIEAFAVSLSESGRLSNEHANSRDGFVPQLFEGYETVGAKLFKNDNNIQNMYYDTLESIEQSLIQSLKDEKEGNHEIARYLSTYRSAYSSITRGVRRSEIVNQTVSNIGTIREIIKNQSNIKERLEKVNGSNEITDKMQTKINAMKEQVKNTEYALKGVLWESARASDYLELAFSATRSGSEGNILDHLLESTKSLSENISEASQHIEVHHGYDIQKNDAGDIDRIKYTLGEYNIKIKEDWKNFLEGINIKNSPMHNKEIEWLQFLQNNIGKAEKLAQTLGECSGKIQTYSSYDGGKCSADLSTFQTAITAKIALLRQGVNEFIKNWDAHEMELIINWNQLQKDFEALHNNIIQEKKLGIRINSQSLESALLKLDEANSPLASRLAVLEQKLQVRSQLAEDTNNKWKGRDDELDL